MQENLSSNVKFIRMNTGEDLLAEVFPDDKDEKYTIINPLKLVYLIGERPGSMMLSLIEWIFPRICDKQEFEVFTSDVLTIGIPTDDMIKYYFDSLSKMEDVNFKFDKDHDSIGKMQSMIRSNKKEEEEISNEEMEAFSQIIDSLKSTKRKLH